MIIVRLIFTLIIFAIPELALSADSSGEAVSAGSSAFLSSEQMYSLLVYSILGSLGVLGLLLGLDKVIVMLFNRSAGADNFKKYSSQSVAQILPMVIEGITVILVVLTVIILGVSKTISAEGTLGILGSIVGYVLGKSSRKTDSSSTTGNGT